MKQNTAAVPAITSNEEARLKHPKKNPKEAFKHAENKIGKTFFIGKRIIIIIKNPAKQSVN